MTERLLLAAAAPFEAARRLADPSAPARLHALHGHGFQAWVRRALPAGGGAPAFAGGQVDALRAELAACIAPLDYQLLNDHLAEPSDDNLARWIAARLALAAGDALGVQSTADQAAVLDGQGAVHVRRRYHFESAHRLPHVPPGHKCGRMHGHGFVVQLDAAVGGDNAAQHAGVLDRCWAPLQRRLHHACLNDLPGLENPTSEHLASWLWQRLQPELPSLRWVTVFETATCGAHFDGHVYRIWKDLGFDSAVRLAQAPADDGRRRVHGHSYRLRLHLAAPLDTVRGWTIDFGDVKAIFNPVYERLDHHPLHELPGIAEGGSIALARWVREQALAGLPQLERVDLYETAGCGVILQWDAAPATLPA